jgi:hypothetical protein
MSFSILKNRLVKNKLTISFAGVSMAPRLVKESYSTAHTKLTVRPNIYQIILGY